MAETWASLSLVSYASGHDERVVDEHLGSRTVERRRRSGLDAFDRRQFVLFVASSRSAPDEPRGVTVRDRLLEQRAR
jgi:hypothetical protein